MPLKKRIVTLDGGQIATAEDVYEAFAIQLGLPEYFGRNLDALWVLLAVDVQGPLEIVWKDAELSRNKLGGQFDLFVALLCDVEAERQDIRIRIC